MLLLHGLAPGQPGVPVHLPGMGFANDRDEKARSMHSLGMGQLLDFQFKILGQELPYDHRTVIEPGRQHPLA